MNIVATNNLTPVLAADGLPAMFGSLPGIGIADYDPALAFGAAAFSVFGIFNIPQEANYDATKNDFGQPIFNFCDFDTTTGKPVNGWGLWNHASTTFCPTLRYFNGWDGATASKFRSYGAKISSDVSLNRFGLWNVVGFSKAANSSSIVAAINGANPGDEGDNTGTATTMGTPSAAVITSEKFPAKVRFFHTVDYRTDPSGGKLNSVMNGAAGLWILDRSFTQAELRAITASPTTLGTAMDSTHLARIVMRSYCGPKAWVLDADESSGKHIGGGSKLIGQ